MSRTSRKFRIPGQWSWHTIEMLESPAWRALSLAARRVLDRLEIELAHHGGKDNGRLPCTYGNFEGYGIRRKSIAGAIRELVTLGFVEVTEKGRAAPEDFGTPNKFRLTYRPTHATNTAIAPTDDWKRIKTEEEGEAVAAEARASRPAFRSQKKRSTRGETGDIRKPTDAELRKHGLSREKYEEMMARYYFPHGHALPDNQVKASG